MSVITLISVIGVTLGVAVLIIVISVMSGFDKELQDRILGFHPHIWVTKRDSLSEASGLLDNHREVIGRVAAIPRVQSAAPYVLGKVMIETQPARGQSLIEAPMMRGMDPRLEANFEVIADSMVAGEADLDGRSVLVGVELAYGLGIRVGDRIAVSSPYELRRMREAQGREIIPPDDYRVTGLFDVGHYEYNANFMITDLENAQDLYGLENRVHGLTLIIDDPFAVEEVRQGLSEELGGNYGVSTWIQRNSVMLNALQVEKSVMFYILFFIMVVAAFGIMNSQITFVVQKTREIGMLRALGTTRSQIIALFLLQSFIVGVGGVASGFGLGMLALKYRNEFLAFMNRMTGFELFPANIYLFAELPALIQARDILVICGSALVICVLAGAVPAWTAARLRPVEALRHD